MNIKERVRELARSEGISLPALETELGFGAGTISRWDKSAPSADKLSAVADRFGVTVDYLIGRSEQKIDVNVLDGVYLSLAKQAQEKGISPNDIMLTLETIERLRGKSN